MARLGRNTAVVISTREVAYEIVVRNQEDQLVSRGASFDLGELAFSYVSQLAPPPINWWGRSEELVTGFAERRLAGYVRDRERVKSPESSVPERSFAGGQSVDE